MLKQAKIQYAHTLTFCRGHGSLFSRGFLDPSLYLDSTDRDSSSYHFRILPTSDPSSDSVMIDDHVLVQHVQSQSYLICHDQPNYKLKGFPIRLAMEVHQRCLFRIRPVRSYDRFGDPLFEHAPFELVNCWSSSYLKGDNIGEEVLLADRSEPWEVKIVKQSPTNHCLICLKSTLSGGLLSHEQLFGWPIILSVGDPTEAMESSYWQLIQHKQSAVLRELISCREIAINIEGAVILQLQDNQSCVQLLTFNDLPIEHGSLVFIKQGGRFVTEDEYKRKVTSTAQLSQHAFTLNMVDKWTSKQIHKLCSAHDALSQGQRNWQKIWSVLQNLQKGLTHQNCYLFRQMAMYELIFPIINQLKGSTSYLQKKVLYLTCQILKQTLQDNPQNKLYTTRWLPQLLLDTIHCPLIQSAVSEIIKQTGSFQIQDQFHQFIDNFIKEKPLSEILLRILRNLCCSGNQPLPSRQDIVLDKLIRHEIVRLESDSQIIPGPRAILKWNNKTFNINLSVNSRNEEFLFVRQYIYLVGECSKGNQQSKALIRKQFRLKQLIDILGKVGDSFAGPILSLIIKGHLDRLDVYSKDDLASIEMVMARIKELLEGQVNVHSFKINAFLFLRMCLIKGQMVFKTVKWLPIIFIELADDSHDPPLDSLDFMNNIQLQMIIQIKIYCLDILQSFIDQSLQHRKHTAVHQFITKGPFSLQDILSLLTPIKQLSGGWQDLLLRLARYRSSVLTVKSIQVLRSLIEFKSDLVKQLSCAAVICTNSYYDLKEIMVQLKDNDKNLKKLYEYFSPLSQWDEGLVHAISEEQGLYPFIKNLLAKTNDSEQLDWIYLILISLAKEYPYIKEEVIKQKLYLKGLSVKGARLLADCLQNNSLLLFNQKVIEQIATELALAIGDDRAKISHLQQVLDVVAVFRSLPIPTNQNIFIRHLLPNFLLNTADILKLLNGFMEHDSYSTMALFEVSCWLNMLATFFHQENIHCLCLCLNRVAFEDCIQVLAAAKHCYFLKAALRAYIRKIYFKNDSQENIKLVLQHMVIGMLEDLNKGFAHIEVDLIVEPDNLGLQYYRRKNLKQIAYTLQLLNHRTGSTVELVQANYFYIFLKLYERMSSLDLQCEDLFELISHLQPAMFKLPRKQRSKSVSHLDQSVPQAQQISKQEERKYSILKQLKHVDITTYYNLPMFNSQYPIAMLEKEDLPKKRYIHLRSKNQSCIMTQSKSQDKSQILFYSFKKNIAELQRQAPGIVEPDLQFCKESLAFCLQRLNENVVDLMADLRLLIFKLIKIAITSKLKRCHFDEVYLWSAEFWLESRTAIQEAQNYLSCSGAPSLLLRAVQHHRLNDRVLNTLFLAGIALLLGGNSKVQSQFIKIFKQHGESFHALSELEQTLVEQMEMCEQFGVGDQELIKYGQVVVKIYRFLQLLSQNNNNIMKKYLFCQQVDYFPVNFVSQAVATIGKVGKLRSIETRVPHLLQFIMDFLNEVTQIPNIEIQRFISGCSLWQYQPKSFTLQRKYILILLSLMESGCPKLLSDLKKNFPKDLSGQVFKNTIEDAGVESIEQARQQMQESGRLGRLEPIADLIKIFQGLQISHPPQYKGYYQLLRNYVRKVEILIYGEVHSVFYSYHPVYDLLPEESKTKMIYAVNRSSRKEKLTSFLSMRLQVSEEIEWAFEYSRDQYAARLLTMTPLVRVGELLSLLINILLVFSYNPRKQAFNKLQGKVSEILSILHIVVVSVYGFYWLNSKIVFLKIRLRRDALQLWRLPMLLLVYVEGSISLLSYWGVSALAFLFTMRLYSLHLIHLMLRFEVLESIIYAIKGNIKALIVVLLFTLMLGYNFAFFFFSQYQEDVRKLADYTHERECSSAMDCFIFLFASGVIGVQTDKIIKIRFFADLIYSFIFQVLISNIIVALLIDRFAELRNARRVIEQEVQHSCFICGITRASLDKRGEKFDEHVQKRHNLWDYQFYVFSLSKKHFTEYTGVEYCIRDALEREDVSWMPVFNQE